MSKKHSVRPGIVFRLICEPGKLPEGLKLRNLEWGVLFGVTGRHTVAQIGEHFNLAEQERDRVFERLLELGLVVEREVSLPEYLRAAATIRDDEPKSLARFLRAGATLGAGAKKPVPPANDETLTRPIAVPARPAPKPEAAPFVPLDAPVPTERRLSLRAVMQLILDRAADRNAGQLDVYRVFIRVSSKLLRRNGITTLRFEDDRLVDDPELQRAITTSVEKTLGLACPPSVFVPAAV